MKDIKAIKGRFYIQRLIDEGEHSMQDFKFAIPDAPKIARSISAFANAEGGRLLVGVKDNGNIAGIRSEEDAYVVEQAAQMCCVPPQQVRIDAFNVGQGTVVLRVAIAKSDKRPVYCREADGRLRAYFRVHDENIVAHPLMVRAWKTMAANGLPQLFSDFDSQLLAMVREAGVDGVDPDGVGRLCHVSAESACQAVVRLCASGLVEFAYSQSGFRLVVPVRD